MRILEPSGRRRQFRLGGAALVAIVLGWPPVVAQDRRASEAELSAVRKEIKELQEKITRETTRRDAGARALRTAEVEIAAATRKLAEVRGDLKAEVSVRRDLTRKTERANRSLAAEKDALARQVRSSYIAGREELTKLLLSQESPASLGRMLVYFDYYNRARSARIGAVAGELQKLAELDAETSRVEAQLAVLEAAQAREVAALEKSRNERRVVVAKLDEEIRDGTAAVSKLRAEEQRLADLVRRLSELMAGFPVDGDEPFAKSKGKLAWPVPGRLAGDFGQPRGAGPVKWNGVLLEAVAGTPVRAVHRGRVAFADWLTGLGLLVIVDHGGGYMSLYGHNEALLKESGDWVEPGEPIAQVGDTGGQSRPGLYFEIRFKGEPVDPNAWMAKRPAAR
ncbi:MAG TPA: peptidoglycan DD-metalloendopeptidase family protein [Gammaproteobacteria bacterium]|nr:peptidoglycan DD-metalloendopeptidase family protein [Gammaproteobacteria bacterium]